MIISIMGSFAEIENEIRKERQMEGIEIAKSKEDIRIEHQEVRKLQNNF